MLRELIGSITKLYYAEKLLKRYLDNHCANSDAEGMSTLCECKLCTDTRTFLKMPVYSGRRSSMD